MTNKILSVLAVVLVLFTACIEEETDPRYDAQLATTDMGGITSDSAIITGFIVAEGDGFTEKGVCYNTEPNPTVADNKVVYTGTDQSATFQVVLTGLDYATKYYAKAYGIVNGAVMYGEEMTFTTLPVVPTVSTAAIESITGSSAVSGGNVTNSGGADVTGRGVCYSIYGAPNVDSSKTENGEGLGEFVSNMTGLLGNAKYYVRAYATNSAGAGYGEVVEFTTPVDLPTVTTNIPQNIGKDSATVSGYASYDGGAAITEKGIVYSTDSLVTVETGTKVIATEAADTGAFSMKLEGLDAGTYYYVKAYAINSAGVGYGVEQEFATQGDTASLWVPGDYQGWSPATAPQIWDVGGTGEFTGYVCIYKGTNTNIPFKFTSHPDWDHTNYGNSGTEGVLSIDNEAGNLTVPDSSMYRFVVDVNKLTWEYEKASWGVIGTAVGGWSDDYDMSWDEENDVLTITMDMVKGQFKFRMNDAWAINFGDDSADGSLEQDGANIDLPEDGNYTITLDLGIAVPTYTVTKN